MLDFQCRINQYFMREGGIDERRKERGTEGEREYLKQFK